MEVSNTHIAPLQPPAGQPAHRNERLEETTNPPVRDILEIEDHQPTIIFQVLDERVQQVGDRQVLQETVEERVEEDGRTIASRIKTITTELDKNTDLAEQTHHGLDPRRIGQLLSEGP